MPLYSHNKKETIYFKGFCAKNSGCTPTKTWWERRIDFIRQAIFAIKQKINWYKSRELTFCLLWERGGKERKKKKQVRENFHILTVLCTPEHTELRCHVVRKASAQLHSGDAQSTELQQRLSRWCPWNSAPVMSSRDRHIEEFCPVYCWLFVTWTPILCSIGKGQQFPNKSKW